MNASAHRQERTDDVSDPVHCVLDRAFDGPRRFTLHRLVKGGRRTRRCRLGQDTCGTDRRRNCQSCGKTEIQETLPETMLHWFARDNLFTGGIAPCPRVLLSEFAICALDIPVDIATTRADSQAA